MGKKEEKVKKEKAPKERKAKELKNKEKKDKEKKGKERKKKETGTKESSKKENKRKERKNKERSKKEKIEKLPCVVPSGSECRPTEVKGQEFYSWDGKYCYHIVAGSGLEQGRWNGKGKKSLCNKKGFKKTVMIGRGKGISSSYTNGDSKSCPGGRKRSASLKIVRSSSTKFSTAKVSEPRTCHYAIVITVPHCKPSEGEPPKSKKCEKENKERKGKERRKKEGANKEKKEKERSFKIELTKKEKTRKESKEKELVSKEKNGKEESSKKEKKRKEIRS